MVFCWSEDGESSVCGEVLVKGWDRRSTGIDSELTEADFDEQLTDVLKTKRIPVQQKHRELIAYFASLCIKKIYLYISGDQETKYPIVDGVCPYFQ